MFARYTGSCFSVVTVEISTSTFTLSRKKKKLVMPVAVVLGHKCSRRRPCSSDINLLSLVHSQTPAWDFFTTWSAALTSYWLISTSAGHITRICGHNADTAPTQVVNPEPDREQWLSTCKGLHWDSLSSSPYLHQPCTQCYGITQLIAAQSRLPCFTSQNQSGLLYT